MENKFRGQRADNKEWVYGSLIECGITGKKYIFPLGSDANESDKVGQDGCLMICTFEIIHETVGQYTGLFDKNNIEICQGDILQGHGNKDDLAKVMFGEFNVIDVDTLEEVDGVIGWYTEVIPTDGFSKIKPFCLSMPLTKYYIDRSEFEIIGNIHTNSELLESR